jgi:peptide/nickel transport system permease protein
MLLFIARRAGAMLTVMAIVALIAFALLRVSPGDPAALMAGDQATPADIERIRSFLGLDAPLSVQLYRWVLQLLSGNLGTSIFSNLPVTELIKQRAEPTISLALSTLLVTITLGVPLGVLAAWKSNSWIDRAVSAISVIGFAVPAFVLAYVMILVFSVRMGLLPSQGFVSISKGVGPFLSSIALPTVTLSLVYIALIMRMTRAAVLDVLSEDYIRTAYAKGASEGRVLFVHALRSAAVPVVTVIGLGVALLIGGVVVTETVYNIAGVGRLVVDAVQKRDYPVLQGTMLIFAGIYVVINFIIDIIYVAADPRIRI